MVSANYSIYGLWGLTLGKKGLMKYLEVIWFLCHKHTMWWSGCLIIIIIIIIIIEKRSMYVFSLIPHRYGKVNSKQSKAGLNSEFSFSKSGCLTEAKEHSLSYYPTHIWSWTDKSMPFERAFAQKWNSNSLVQVLTRVNVSIFDDGNCYPTQTR